MLEKLIIEVLLGELGIKRDERAVFLGRIRERSCIGHILRPILRHLSLGYIVVLLGFSVASQKILHI